MLKHREEADKRGLEEAMMLLYRCMALLIMLLLFMKVVPLSLMLALNWEDSQEAFPELLVRITPSMPRFLNLGLPVMTKSVAATMLTQRLSARCSTSAQLMERED